MKTLCSVMALALFTFVNASVNAAILQVAKTGATYSTVQSAYDAAGANDTVVIIDSGVYTELLTLNKDQITVKGQDGLSPMPTIQSPSGSHAVGCANNPTNNTLENLSFSAAEWPALEFGGTGTLTINNCFINGNTCSYGAIHAIGKPLVLNNCTVTGGDDGIRNESSNVTLNNCSVTTNTSSSINMNTAGSAITTVNNSTLGGSPYAIAVTGDNVTANFNQCKFTALKGGGCMVNLQATGANVTLDRPVFTGGNCAYPIYLAKNSTLTVKGTPTQKVNLDPAWGNPSGRSCMFGGTLNLIDVYNSANDWGFLASVWRNAAYDSAVNVNFDRCEMLGNGFNFWFGAEVVDPIYAVSFHATNCIFRNCASLNTDDTSIRTVVNNYTFDHCTFTGAGAGWINAAVVGTDTGVVNDIVTGNYTIWDSRTQTAAPSKAVLSGKLNIVTGTGFTAGQPTDTIIATDPGLKADGRLLISSPAKDAAMGSTLDIDIDGNARPFGAKADIGANECMLVPVELSSFSAE